MKTERTDELYKVLLTKGYPKELCSEIAYNILNTDYTATRMLGYLYRYTEPRMSLNSRQKIRQHKMQRGRKQIRMEDIKLIR